jgi:SAM-dependent methyltransferase
MAKDLFSSQAVNYSKYRPDYPPELFGYILQFVQNKNAVWDCATGNGQAARALAEHFEKVYATDISANQLKNAIVHPRISYSVGSDEQSGLSAHSCDLVTVAQAYHWFNFEGFRNEALRVLKPGGLVAVWCYSLIKTNDDALNRSILYFYKETIGKYWDVERKYVDEEYKTIPFPFKNIQEKEFSIHKNWSLDDLLGYLETWSALQHYIKATGTDPLKQFRNELTPLWPPTQKTFTFTFPIFLKLGNI